jgi:hypothetical protein
VVVALASLELFGEGLGILRYRIYQEGGVLGGGFGVIEPQFVIRDRRSGRELPWSPRGSSGSDTETDGEVEILELPVKGRSRSLGGAPGSSGSISS